MKTAMIDTKVKNYIEANQMILTGDTVAAGVSGGADSVCLLYILWKLSKQIDFKLLAVHVHHGVRQEAEEDAAYVEQLCKKLEIPFFLKRVDMYAYAKEKGLSPEEAGRKLRYEAFAEVLKKQADADQTANADQTADADWTTATGRQETKYKIAVAHHKNDRAETMLFHLFRGSGLTGLCGIRPVRGNIIRPLLCLERAEIEAYLKEKEIAFCIDKTNEEDTYTRNKIRHHILPYAEAEINQNVIAHMGDAADILTEAEEFIQKQTLLACKRCVRKEQADADKWIEIDLEAFHKEDAFMKQRILLSSLEKLTPHRKDITKEHIQTILALAKKEGSKELALPYGLVAYKEYNRLLLGRKKKEGEKEQETALSFPVTVPGEIKLPDGQIIEFTCLSEEDFFYKKGQIIPEKTYTKWFDYDKITKTLMVRTRKTGDYLTIDTEMKKKSVKEYMVNEKIPKVQRNQLFLLAEGNHVLWLPAYRISQYYKVNENTKRILQVRIRGGR